MSRNPQVCKKNCKNPLRSASSANILASVQFTRRGTTMTVQSGKPSRKSAFRAALALARMTQVDFARAHGVTPGHLSLVVNGERESARLTAIVDAFIAEHLPSMAVGAA